jgi:hypothetical protein
VKIKNLTIQGFRGFNEEQTIEFHEHLTLIYAPNSYGKTSISEALEWLLYGVTSKVEKADSKDEYKGSYRNRHLLDTLFPSVKVRLIEKGNELTLTGELRDDDTVRKFIGESAPSVEVDEWPFAPNLSSAPYPFILQHALKYLLLTNPDDRFKGFARLLALESLDEIHRNIISLCTAPERRIPTEVKELQGRISSLETRLTNCSSLPSLQKVFKRKTPTITEIYDTVKIECQKKVPTGTEDAAIFPQLLKSREEAVGKVFKGRITLTDYSSVEKQQNAEDEQFFITCLPETFIREYTELIALANIDHVLKRARFFNFGIEFLKATPNKCPFCDRPLDEPLSKHLFTEHSSFVEQTKYSEGLEKQRTRTRDTCKTLMDRLIACQNRHVSKGQPVLELSDSLEELKLILVPKHESYFQKLNTVLSKLSPKRKKLELSYNRGVDYLEKVISSVDKSTEDSVLMQTLGDSLIQYVSDVNAYTRIISERAPIISDVDQVLQHELDILAGTEDISLLIDFLDQIDIIKKKLEIDSIIDNLKELRRITDNYVAKRMLRAISGELTSEVMNWYNQIKTTGDPDVHFDGFDMERTQKGEIKARRVRINAKSYGEELVSAVSSLSESKLNALGLCVSIATNIRGQSPFEFLIIDDPIQSLDTEHEAQFVQVIRALVEKCGKQVIVLSHNRQWLEQVCVGCCSLNGWFYEITGYTQRGPHISSIAWRQWQERLKVVNAILGDPAKGTIELQHAEEDIRIVVTELTSELYKKKKGVTKSPHSLNSTQVEKMLNECGVETSFVNQIIQTFCTTDDSHHAPADYCPDRERIRQYLSWTHDLAKLIN